MRILFVCWANVGRSQMAASFYNHLTGTKHAAAAGTKVEIPGETLGERRARRGGTHVIDSMMEEGIDISNNIQTQLLEKMLDHYDRVISMADYTYTPTWLREHPRFEYWEVKDPGGKGPEETKVARDIIKAKVEELIKQGSR